MEDKAIILFDGICNLCNRAIQFIIKHDPSAYFSFASLQSDFSKELLSKMNIHLPRMSSVILIEKGVVYDKSAAILKISGHLSGGWKYLSVFRVFPPFIRDALYIFIAKHRYWLFGKREKCMIPGADIRQRFLD